MPLKVYLALNSDWGYVSDPFFKDSNPLANRLLIGGGLGLDFVLYFDKIIRIEYNFNHLGENGLFLHFNFTP